MDKAIINFEKCIQNYQEYGSASESMISRIFFSITTPKKTYNQVHADVKQIAGSRFETSPIEVYPPKDIKENLDYEQLRDAIEKYYRKCVGKSAQGINIQGGKSIQMQNNIFSFPMQVEIDIHHKEAGW
ncbi:MAG: hypothetical protein GF353_00555 [Candidatus Lokiarchaeota archaeon]|nr:hypothetical protein [Candidatus Lokiarchaeota archaeon]